MPDYYVPKRLTPDTKHAKVQSGFGLCQNEANLDKSRNDISVCDKLANAWTETRQGMTKFPMNQNGMYDNHMPVNEYQISGNNTYPNDANVTARRASRQLDYGTGEHGTAYKSGNNPD